MQCESRGLRRLWAMGTLVCAAAVGVVLPDAAQSDPKAAGNDIRASYRVGVGAIDLGTFDLVAAVDQGSYALKATGEFSILAGLIYRGKGKTKSEGTRNGLTALPRRFDFAYSDNRKKQKMQIVFDGPSAPEVTRTPKKRPDKKAVPLSEDQLQSALDPLTAAFLSVQADLPAGDLAVCNRTFRVFDGKRLFTLSLSPKRVENLGPKSADGLRKAAVCAVRYEPIGGHRPGNSTVQFLQQSEDIEAWLVPVSGTSLFVPYKVVVPTAWGDGTATLKKLTAKATEGQRSKTP